MNFKNITVGELPSFIKSEWYQNTPIMPITKERAISQYYNPDADHNDIALIIALDKDNQLLGFIGILPGKINYGKSSKKFFWNSCWWVHPDRGRQVSMPLFYKMLQITDNKLIFFDLTPRTHQIMQKLPYFVTQEKIGISAFLRCNSACILPKKYGKFAKIKPILNTIDSAINILTCPYRKIVQFRLSKKPSFQFLFNDEIDGEIQKFIAPFIQQQAIPRGKRELNRIIRYAWISNSQKAKQESSHYPFSVYAFQFYNHIIKIYSKEQLVGCLFITERDQYFKLPYCFFHPEHTTLIVKVLKKILLQRKAIHFVTWNPYIKERLGKQKTPFLLLRPIKKQMGFPQIQGFEYLQHAFYQDGDGDAVFT